MLIQNHLSLKATEVIGGFSLYLWITLLKIKLIIHQKKLILMSSYMFAKLLTKLTNNNT